jgi:hypothetical protein
MKNHLLVLVLIFYFNAQAQMKWKKDELNVLQTFELDTTDHRGFILKPIENTSISSKAIIEDFLASTEKKDITEISLPIEMSLKIYFSRPLDLHELIEFYLKLSK